MAYKNKTIIFNQENNFIGVTTLVLIFEKSKFYVVFYMYRIFFIHSYLINKSKKNLHRLKIKIEHQLWRKGLRAQILFFDCRFFFEVKVGTQNLSWEIFFYSTKIFENEKKSPSPQAWQALFTNDSSVFIFNHSIKSKTIL